MREKDYTTKDKIYTQKTFVSASKNRPGKTRAGKQERLLQSFFPYT